MENSKHSQRRTLDGRTLTFVRRASDGRELSETELGSLALTNDTIVRVVSTVADRIAPDAGGLGADAAL